MAMPDEGGALRPDTVTREQWLRAKLVQLSRAADSAMESESWQGYAAICRQEKTVRDELDELIKEKGEEDPTSMPEEEFVAHLRDAARDMPEGHLRVFVEEYRDRHNLQLLTTDAA